jgi:putative hydrolase of HD superfamily
MANTKPDDVAHPVEMQAEAYNARDIEAFMQWWADDCQYYAFPSTLLANGAKEIRDRHIERFKEPDLFGRVLTRAVVGNVVVDHETVQRTFPEGPGELDVICIYEILEGKIAKAWFKMGERRLHRRLHDADVPAGAG